MKTCLVLGSGSDIAQQIMPAMAQDYHVIGWRRGEDLPRERWDLCLITIGMVAPVGLWHDVPLDKWLTSIDSNLCEPFILLTSVWNTHNPGATVCFFAGSNPNMIMSGYCAYNVGKMGLLKLVEQIDHETPDAKFFALNPGIFLTKIHDATIESRWDNPKLAAALRGEGKVSSAARVVECLKWVVDQPKEVIGGRNLCVSDPWDSKIMRNEMEDHSSMFKLRRYEGS